jgi:ankyrin repeat protein
MKTAKWTFVLLALGASTLGAFGSQEVAPAAGAPSPSQDIFAAIRGGDAAKVEALIQRDPTLVKARSPRRSTPLHVAVDVNNVPLVRFLIDKGAELDAVNQANWTPLFYAKGVEAAGLLLEKGAAVDPLAGDFTPLIQFVWSEKRELADLLLSKGAKVPAPKTPLGLLTAIRALRIGSLRYFEEGLKQGLDPLYESEGGGMWLHYAAESRFPELAGRLVGLRVPVDRKNVFGLTPLHVAASRGNTAVVKLLVEKGADMNARTNDGQTPYNLAVGEERGETAELLRSLGADQGPSRFPSLTGDYLGQAKPGKKAVLFAPGIVSGRYTYHGSIAVTPDGDEMLWSVGGGRDIMTFRVRRAGGRWTAPEMFSQGDVPFVSRDGKRLYSVGYAAVGGTDRETVFVRDRTASGWSEPRPMPEVINSLPAIHWGVSEDLERTFYFSSEQRIRYSEWRNGRYGEAVVLDSLKDVNAYSPFVAPDGSYLLGSIENEGERMFIIFRKKDGSWTEAVDLADIVGVPHGFCPTVTPDGRYLFFLNMVDGLYAPYWMDASFIGELRKRSLEGR